MQRLAAFAVDRGQSVLGLVVVWVAVVERARGSRRLWWWSEMEHGMGVLG